MNLKKVEEAASLLQQKIKSWDANFEAKIAIVLGSGLGSFADNLKKKLEISFDEVPHIPSSTVAGHAGKFVFGYNDNDIPVVVQQGRIHYYEGHSLFDVTLPVRVLKQLGIEHVILTTSTGSVNPDYNPGEFVLICDHINFPQVSPLMGLAKEFGERFVDMSEPYNMSVLEETLHLCQNQTDFKVHQGVFAMCVGPHYETPAEIKALQRLGADVVSMSLVPETIVARQCGLKVNAIANITNYGSGLKKQILDHSHVAKAAKASAKSFAKLAHLLIETAQAKL